MPIAQFDDVRVHFQLEGPEDAPVLALSNSLGTDMSMWDKVAPAWAARFRVLRYDSRGHGQSSVTAPPYSIELLARDLLKLLDHLGLERINLCGLSLGGLTAIWLGIHEPSRFDRLIFANTAAKIGNAAMWNERIGFIHENGMAPLASATMHRWFTERFIQRWPEQLEMPRSVMESTAADGYIGCCLALRDEDLRGQIGRISNRCLVISSAHDVATPAADGRLLHQELRDGEYVELEAAHLSAWERPEEFQTAVLRFLS